MPSITFTLEALRTATSEQIAATLRLCQHVNSVRVTTGSFDLPNGYLAFEQTGNHGSILGGIDVNGDVST